MAIKKRPDVNKGADKFIAGAPDAHAAPETTRGRIIKGNREQISVTVPLGLVESIDRLKTRLGVSRAAIINMAIVDLLEAKGEK